MLQICTITGLIGQRLARSVNSLRILFEHCDNLRALHLVCLGGVLLGGSLRCRRRLGEALALLLSLGLGIAIGVLVLFELGRESPQHGDGSLRLTQTSHSKGDTKNKEDKKKRKIVCRLNQGGKVKKYSRFGFGNELCGRPRSPQLQDCGAPIGGGFVIANS